MRFDLSDAVKYPRLATQISILTDKRLRQIRAMINVELRGRRRWHEERRAAFREAMNQLANAMAGITWAMGCRSALRESKGHRPPGGRRPMHGAPWLPHEVIAASRCGAYIPLMQHSAEAYIKALRWRAALVPPDDKTPEPIKAGGGRNPEFWFVT